MRLLDYLAAKLRLEYLSDLGFLKDFNNLKEIVDSIPSDKYSVEEWNDAIRYFTKEPVEFASAEEAKEFCLKY